VRVGSLALALCGCAAELTPQQEWAMKNFEECKRETNAINAKLTRVTPDGQMYIEASQTQTSQPCHRVHEAAGEPSAMSPSAGALGGEDWWS